MSDSLNYLLTGFFGQSANILQDRRELADQYFADQYAIAREYQTKSKASVMADVNARKADIGRLRSLGVPGSVVSRAMADDPDLVTSLADNLEKLAAKGVDITNPEVYSGLEQAAKDQGISTNQLIQESGDAIANNAAADPYGFKASPLDAIRATLSGFTANPLDRAQARLDSTQMGEKTASEWIATGGVPENNNNDVPVGINWGSVGEELRSVETTEPLSPNERESVVDFYEQQKEKELEKLKASKGSAWLDDREGVLAEAEVNARVQTERVYGSDVVNELIGGVAKPDLGSKENPFVVETPEDLANIQAGQFYRAPDGTLWEK